MSSGFLKTASLAGAEGDETQRPALAPSGLFERTLQEADGALRQFLQRHLRSSDILADAAQETYLRMLRYRGVESAAEIRALLFRVASTVVSDQYRRAKSRCASEHDAVETLELPSLEPAPERVLQGHQDLAMVRDAIGSLPPRCRQVFLLHRFEGMSYKEIARRFGTSERTVENQVARALAVCRQAIGETRR